MKLLTVYPLLLIAGLAFAQVASQPAGDPKTRVLVITGRDVAAHNWRETTPVLREHLEKSGKFEIVVSEEPLVLESSAALATYDVILLNYYNWQRPTITDKAKENLLAFVRSGKGLVSFHFSARAFEEWPEYRNLIGRVWTKGSGHGPRGSFQAKVVAKGHYITQGTSDFAADDELYSKLVGDTPITVLVEAYSEWSKRTEPLAWTLPYGEGRVFNIVFGHDVRACRNPDFARLLVRGTEWAARREIPKNARAERKEAGPGKRRGSQGTTRVDESYASRFETAPAGVDNRSARRALCQHRGA